MGIAKFEAYSKAKATATIDAAAFTIAQSWYSEHPEFEDAVASKVFIIDSREFTYKRTLMHLGIKPGYDAYKGVFFK